MKKWLPLLIILNLKAQTNLFRLYPQAQPPINYDAANISSPVKTSDGGYVFSCSPYTPNQQTGAIDFITVKTNPNFIPEWRRRNYSKVIPLPSGGIISIYQNSNTKAYVDKQTLSGQVIWSKEIKGPNSYSNAIASCALADGIGYGNKFRVIGATFIIDVSGAVQYLEPFTAEFDTSTGNAISAHKLTSVNTSTISSPPYYYTNIYRDSQGSFYFIGSSRAGITKFSASLTFMWQLSWINATNNPKVTGIKFTSNNDLFCSMLYYDTVSTLYSAGIMKVNNPANIVIERRLNNVSSFSGIENMPSGNFIFSFIHQQPATDNPRTHLLAVDPNAGVLWCKSYHESMAVSPPYNMGTGEYLLSSMCAKTSSSGAQNPIAFTIDQYGNSSCTSKTLNISVNIYSSTPVLGTITAAAITLTVSNTTPVTTSPQSFRDSCGGAGLGLVNVDELKFSENIQIWPNPVVNKINISFSKNTIKSVLTVYNLMGEICKKVELEEETIDLSGLSNGIYLISISEDTRIIVSKKIVVLTNE